MSVFLALNYIPDDRPSKYDVGKKEHLAELYKILRAAADDQLATAREKHLHPEDRKYARDEYRVLDGSARAIRMLMRKTHNLN